MWNDQKDLWSRIASPSYDSFSSKQKEFVKYFVENCASKISRTQNNLISIGDASGIIDINDKIRAASFKCDDLAFLSRVVIFYALWNPDPNNFLENHEAWWKFGIAIDFILSEIFQSSGKRWGNDLMFDDRSQELSLAADFEIYQGIFFREGLPVGPANENTLDIYLGNVAETLNEKEAVKMTFTETMQNARWLPWIEALNNVP